MPVDDEDLREVLRLFPIYQIRMIIDERGVDVKSKDQEELIDALVEENWTDEEFDELVERLQTIQEDGRPLSYYLCDINEQVSIADAEQELRRNEAEFSDDGGITEGGFQIHMTSETELEATRWKIDVEREFNFRTGEVETSEEIKPVDFHLDLEKNLVYIDTNQYGKALNIATKLETIGFEFDNIGHRNRSADEANEQVRNFVESIEEKIE